jgi:glycolate oxidase
LTRATEVYDRIIAESARLGGVYSGEHGTGKRKRRDFLRCYGPEAVEQVRRSKAALDPEFLLNRGDVIEYKDWNSVVRSQDPECGETAG